jgi:undecaprenyl-diphosphatase
MLLLIGSVVSFVVALITVKWLLAYVRTHDFTFFGIYRIVIALLCAAIFFL